MGVHRPHSSSGVAWNTRVCEVACVCAEAFLGAVGVGWNRFVCHLTLMCQYRDTSLTVHFDIPRHLWIHTCDCGSCTPFSRANLQCFRIGGGPVTRSPFLLGVFAWLLGTVKGLMLGAHHRRHALRVSEQPSLSNCQSPKSFMLRHAVHKPKN